MSGISLTSSMRSNLLSLQGTSKLIDLTQQRLSTGKKVNSAIDNPSNFYTAQSLNNRAKDLDALLDSMGQAISTIKAASEAMESGLGLLEQATSIANQVLSEAKVEPMGDQVELVDNSAELIAAGYTPIDSTTSYDDLLSLFSTEGAKIVLTEDVDLSEEYLEVYASNITINGGGHKLTHSGFDVYESGFKAENIEIETSSSTVLYSDYDVELKNVRLICNGTNSYSNTGLYFYGSSSLENVSIELNNANSDFAVGIDADGDVDIKGLYVSIKGKYGAGIRASSGTTTVESMGIMTEGSNVCATYETGGTISGLTKVSDVELTYPNSWFDGEGNTKIILKELGDKALAAKACNEYNVGTEADFAAGTWYLPAMGELEEMYAGKSAITTTLQKLEEDHSVDTDQLSGYLWSSSEYYNGNSWDLLTTNGNRYYYTKTGSFAVRSFQLIENCFTPLTLSADGTGGSGGTAAPKVGDIMYTDKSWGSVDQYDSSKTVAGVVASVGDDGSVKIMSLKDVAKTEWSTSYTDVKGLENVHYRVPEFIENSANAISVKDANNSFAKIDTSSYQAQYNEVLNQYDSLIGDASYKGVNLLKNDDLSVRFNEDGSSKLDIVGQDASSQALGLNEAKWETFADVATTISQLRDAINTIRSINNELGNNYAIVQSRENFTESLINILTEGADKLTLADMNEESANMLSLQTRQQLAVNALSLASQASQSVLKLF